MWLFCWCVVLLLCLVFVVLVVIVLCVLECRVVVSLVGFVGG
jgi:hypothetical protein